MTITTDTTIRRDIAEILDVNLELAIERIPFNLLRKDDILGIGLELRKSLFLGDELDAAHARVGGKLLLEVVDVLERCVVRDVDRDLADPVAECLQHLREGMAHQQVDAGEDEDERYRQHRGKAYGEISPEALPGAVKRELEISQHHRGTYLNGRPERSVPRRSR